MMHNANLYNTKKPQPEEPRKILCVLGRVEVGNWELEGDGLKPKKENIGLALIPNF